MSGTIHPLVSRLILENTEAGNANGDFNAVGLFVDISGFSAMTDVLMGHGQHGAEVLAEIMRAVLNPMMETIFGQAGFIASSAGDALTALFPVDGHPLPAARQALSAARAIQAHMAEHSVFDTTYRTFPMSVKIGLALGEVHWGIILPGGSARGAYYFQGTAVEGCAAAEHQARAGDVIIDAALRELLQEHITVEPVDAFYRVQQDAGDLPAPRVQPQPGIDPLSVARFFPLSLVTQELSGEFRQVVSMFVALPTVTTANQLQIFMTSLLASLEKWGGLLNRLDFGDKGTSLLIFWGAPLSTENDIERALSFILELQNQTSIPINAGITYRISHAGFIGGRLHEEYTCFGRGVNLAARFMTAAPRGEIWVDEAIAERAARKFEIEFVETRSFKGFSNPQKVFALYERKLEIETFFSGALAGRAQELAALRAFTAPIFSGKYAGMLAITGEPGIGKSRLVYELIQQLEDEHAPPFRFFLGQTDEILRQPFNPFIYWLRNYLGVSDAQGEVRSKRSFNRKLDDLIASLQDRGLAAELDRTRSFLGALVGLHWNDSLYDQLEAEGRYQNTLIALTTLLQAASLQSPVIFLLEDIHWLDTDSAALLLRMLRVLLDPDGPACPVAILATSREEPEPFRLEGSPVQQIAMKALDREALRGLASGLLSAPAADSLLDLIAGRAEGNPFFAEQILHYLRDESRLVLDGGAWTVEQAKIHALPVDVNMLLVARLDHLTQQVKEAVQTAAVLGREFEVHLLSFMLGSQAVPPEVAAADVQAAEREAIWTALSEIRYIFKHSLLREAAYEMQVHARRKTLHALAFEAYHHLYAADLSSHYGELAYHAGQADLRDEARRYLRLAGKAAYDTYQNAQAVEQYSQALALTPESDLAGRYELLMSREDVFQRLGRQADCERDLAEVEGLLPGLNQVEKEIDFLLRRAVVALDRSICGDVEDYAARAAILATEHGLPEKVAQANRQLGLCAFEQGRYEIAGEYFNRALQMARETQSSYQECRAQNNLGLLALERMQFDAAEKAFSTALENARQAGDLYGQAMVLNNLGSAKNEQGNYWQGQEYLMQANEICRKVGNRFGEGMTTGNLGFIAGKMGEYQKARAFYERAIRISREIGSLSNEVIQQINLSACLAALQDTEAAVAHARAALEIARKIGYRSGEAWALTYLGHNLLEQDEHDAAVEAYAGALIIRQELGQPVLVAEPAAGLARAALRRDDQAAAQASFEPVLAHLDGGGNLDGCDEPFRVYLTGFQVLSQLGDPRAGALLETAHRLLQEQSAKIPNEDSRAAFLNIAHHQEILQAWEKLHPA